MPAEFIRVRYLQASALVGQGIHVQQHLKAMSENKLGCLCKSNTWVCAGTTGNRLISATEIQQQLASLKQDLSVCKENGSDGASAYITR